MKIKTILILQLMLSVVLLSKAQERLNSKCYMMEQPNSPITIVDYSCNYYSGSYLNGAGIHHKVNYQNTSESKVVAIQFGLISFNVWNELLDRIGGTVIENIEPGETDKGTWVNTPYSDFSFLTGVAYVAKVRFSDGRIWEEDKDHILSKLNKLNFIFTEQAIFGTENNESNKPSEE